MNYPEAATALSMRRWLDCWFNWEWPVLPFGELSDWFLVFDLDLLPAWAVTAPLVCGV
jgi:hypothetical protein